MKQLTDAEINRKKNNNTQGNHLCFFHIDLRSAAFGITAIIIYENLCSL